MRILIYAMPRTRSSMIHSMIEAGGNPMLYEPFHWEAGIRNMTSGLPKWDGVKGKFPYMNETLGSKTGGLKTLVPHHSIDEAILLHKWADLVIHLNRPFLEIACSFHIASMRGKWNNADPNPGLEKVSLESVKTVFQWDKNRRAVEAEVWEKYPCKIIHFNECVTTKGIAKALALRAVSTGEPTTERTRSKSPLDMVSNLDEVAKWHFELLKEN